MESWSASKHLMRGLYVPVVMGQPATAAHEEKTVSHEKDAESDDKRHEEQQQVQVSWE